MALDTLLTRIEQKQQRRGAHQCWPWLGFINGDGEARIWLDDERGSISVPAALFIARGIPIPPGKEALSCPILKDCSNPDHVSLATRDVIADRILWSKGLTRRNYGGPIGPRRPRRKLSDEQVRQIYLSKAPTSELAEKYDVTQGQISNIRAGRLHKHITEPLRLAQEEDRAEGLTSRP